MWSEQRQIYIANSETRHRSGNLAATSTTGSAGGSSTRNAYRADGTRLIRRTTAANGASTTTLYRSDGTEVTCLNLCAAASATDKARAIRPVVTTDRGVPIATRTTAGWTYLLGDQQHSLMRDTDGTVRRTTYGPYGDTPTTGTPPTPTAPNAPGAHGYLNQPHDPNGDIRLEQRNYTPSLAILTTPDPLLNTTDPQNANPYAYARNNPIAGSDPTGLVNQSNENHNVSDYSDPGPTPPTDADGHTYFPGTPEVVAYDMKVMRYNLIRDAEELLYPQPTMSDAEFLWNATKATAQVAVKVVDVVTNASATWNACTNGGWDCTGNLAMAVPIPFTKLGKIAVVADDLAKAARVGDDVATAANSGSRLAEASAAAFSAGGDPASMFIKNKHLASAGGSQAKFLTDDISEVQGLISRGLRSDGAQFLPNGLNGTFRAIIPAGRSIGTKGQTNIRVIVTDDGRVIKPSRST